MCMLRIFLSLSDVYAIEHITMVEMFCRQDVTVELHSPPPMVVSNTVRSSPLRTSPINSPQQNQSMLHHLRRSTSNSRRTNDLICNDHNSSNIVVTIDPAVTAATTDTDDCAIDVRPIARDSCTVREGFERHAPLASLDIEFGTSSSSSSSNVKVSNVDSFTI